MSWKDLTDQGKFFTAHMVVVQALLLILGLNLWIR